jgi:hypothetical protein
MRDKIRGLTVGRKKQFKRETVDLGDGVIVEVKQPSVKERSKLVQEAHEQGKLIAGKEQGFDPAVFQVLCIIQLTYEPGTDTRVYERADFDSMMENPTESEGWLDKIGEVAMKMVNVKKEEVKKT